MSATVIERLSSPALPKQLNFFVPRPINNTVSRGAPLAIGRGGHESIGGLNMWKLLTNLRQDESGQDLIEYALVAALIALGAVASMKTVSTAIGNAFATINTQLGNALAGG